MSYDALTCAAARAQPAEARAWKRAACSVTDGVQGRAPTREARRGKEGEPSSRPIPTDPQSPAPGRRTFADAHAATHTMKTFRRTLFLSCLLAAVATGTAMHAAAQPTGNPKGTTAPTDQRSSHPGTPRPSGDARPGEAATNPDAPAARSGALRQPGTGTAGGLSGRHPGDGSKTGTTTTDQAPPAGPAAKDRNGKPSR